VTGVAEKDSRPRGRSNGAIRGAGKVFASERRQATKLVAASVARVPLDEETHVGIGSTALVDLSHAGPQPAGKLAAANNARLGVIGVLEFA
jgi:hypothetical protein